MRVATQAYQFDDIAADYERMLDFGDDAMLLDAEATRKEVALADLPRRGVEQGQDRAGGSGPAGLGARRRLSIARRADPRALARRMRWSPTAGRSCSPPRAARCGPTGLRWAPTLSVATAAGAALRDSGVRLRDGHRTAVAGPAGRRSRWQNRQGIGDSGNQFHYYRLTDDNCIIWGGYDAIYHFAGRIDSALDQRPATYRTGWPTHFFDTFPQLEGLRFTHTWGGVIDTCSRFFPFFGTGYRGRVAYATGYTGLGVGCVAVRRPGDAGSVVRPEDRTDRS